MEIGPTTNRTDRQTGAHAAALEWRLERQEPQALADALQRDFLRVDASDNDEARYGANMSDNHPLKHPT